MFVHKAQQWAYYSHWTGEGAWVYSYHPFSGYSSIVGLPVAVDMLYEQCNL